MEAQDNVVEARWNMFLWSQHIIFEKTLRFGDYVL
jgi:hypothetical protein